MQDSACHKTVLREKLVARTATIGVVGLGYVGLPLLLRFAEAGFRVVGFDNDPAKIDDLAAGRCYIGHIKAERVARARRGGFEPTGDMARIAEVDAVILCLPTPLGAHRDPDLGYVLGTVDTIAPYLRPAQVVSLESTTYPGTTDEEVRPRIEARGLTVGSDIFLVYSPEREDPGNPTFSVERIPKICGGVTAACLEVGSALYGAAIERVVPVSSTRAAELTKLLENIHRAVNIGLVNEMKIVAEGMGIDIHEVIDAAATKPFGFVPYQPGPGLGGHCIPIDPFYLSWKAREYGIETRFIELAGEVNSAMPDYVVARLTGALNAVRKPVSGSRILVLGVAYKKNVGDIRESPALVLIEKLRDLGAEVAYSDPHRPVLPKTRKHDLGLESVEVTAHALAGYDCILVATDHDAFDFDMIETHAALIVDARGRYRKDAPHIVRA